MLQLNREFNCIEIQSKRILCSLGVYSRSCQCVNITLRRICSDLCLFLHRSVLSVDRVLLVLHMYLQWLKKLLLSIKLAQYSLVVLH